MSYDKSSQFQERKFSRFIRTVQTNCVVILLFVVLCNWIVDPYGILNSPNIHGFNQLKPEKTLLYSRLFKAIEITRIKPKTVFLGSSRIEFGLEPTHPSLVNKQPVYNLGLPGPSMYEVMRYFQHVLANQPQLKNVIVGVDFFMFNAFDDIQPAFSENRLEKQGITLKDLLDVSLSLDTLQASKNTVLSNLDNSNLVSPYTSLGRRSETYYLQTSKPFSERYKDSITGFLGADYKNYYLSNKQLNYLKFIINTCQQREIDLKIFISPSHAAQMEAIRIVGLWQEFEQWKRELSKMAPVWDFSGYNSITSEPVSNGMKNYLDSSHYRKNVGDLVINRLFSYQEEKVPSDFGTLITPANVEAHLTKIRADREVWAEKNLHIVNLVQDLALAQRIPIQPGKDN
jgi:hypothetical protein